MSAILKFIRENHILAIIEHAIAKKKTRISLNSYEITEIPAILYTCLEVEHLYLHLNNITNIPVQITQLLNLTTLTLDYNNISALPSEIGNLKNLVNLNISYNPLKVLIPEIGDLESLEAFWCNKIGLQEIPKEIGKLSKLDTFGARGNELKTIPEEMTNLTKLRWLTLERNQIDTLPDSMDRMEALIHCNLRNNRLEDFPKSLLKCKELLFLQLNENQISSFPDDFDPNAQITMEMIDIRQNPICDLKHPVHSLLRYTDDGQPAESPPGTPLASASHHGAHAAQALAANATALRLPAAPVARVPDPIAYDGLDMEVSSASSEDWENSVNSSELDVQYQSDEEREENDVIALVLPELSRYASTAF